MTGDPRKTLTLELGDKPRISAVVCTRNRGKQVIETIDSILANQCSSFELLVIDQSTNAETSEAIQPYLSDPRFCYISTSTHGAGLSRNIGLEYARADIVAYTDDDCTVSSQWLTKFENIFNANPKVAIVFCSIAAGSYDPDKGAIPNNVYPEDQIVHSLERVL